MTSESVSHNEEMARKLVEIISEGGGCPIHETTTALIHVIHETCEANEALDREAECLRCLTMAWADTRCHEQAGQYDSEEATVRFILEALEKIYANVGLHIYMVDPSYSKELH